MHGTIYEQPCEVCLEDDKMVDALVMCRGLEVCMDCFHEGGI